MRRVFKLSCCFASVCPILQKQTHFHRFKSKFGYQPQQISFLSKNIKNPSTKMSPSAQRSPEDVVAEVFSLLEAMGSADYIGESVSQLQHALQAGHLAQQEGFPVHVILGALFHDVGHLVGEQRDLPPMRTGEVILGTQNHEVVGLTEASKMTLEHQGGPMTPEEVESFRANPQHEAILRMRTWDEKAKDPKGETPSLQHFKSMCLEYLKAVD
ncbi:2-amino-1-hydroxyethylphosphonate dioxygenase (glycine-forming)-like isoform X2 [Oratosquilla oratoria]|uniref:2-amino-1-hydroxyethylphosphonate dioxygenase (glycine-forming)-like isoform X2 n=1 Tax=Oratosquilla oratoria TaxID=337810 RepID=UPI003F75BF91